MKKHLFPKGANASGPGSNRYRESGGIPELTCGLFLLVGLLAACVARAQEPASFRVKPPISGVVTPASSIPGSGDRGVRAHSDIQLATPGSLVPDEAPPFSGYGYETPASLACVYGLVKVQAGCNPNSTTLNPLGGSQSIAVVEPFYDPYAPGDLAYFSAQFGIPFKTPQLEVVYESGFPPEEDYTGGGWALATATNLEWAHAFAPNAKIYLVETNSPLWSDLFTGVSIGSNLVRCGQPTCTSGTGKGEVVMGWSGQEFSGEAAEYDSYFQTPGVVYVAETGYIPGPTYPSASPYVVAVGGSSNVRSLTTGNLTGQRSYDSAGGGLSLYESRPSYQNSISSLVGSSRGTPDMAFVSSPSSALWAYNSYPLDGEEGWFIVWEGGAAEVAGIINAAGNFAASTNAELTNVYGHLGVPQAYNDVAYGTCGLYSGSFAVFGWDQCTGVGTPNGYLGK